MAGLQSHLEDLKDLGASVLAASVDTEDKSRELASSLSLSFPLACGATRDLAYIVGTWWEDDRKFIRPAEFIAGEDGKVISSTYSSGPIGRTDAADIVALLRVYEGRRAGG